MKKVSILMATYNPIEKLLYKSIDSIINQTYKNIEIIIVDDGSNVDIKELILKKFELQNIIFIKNSENKGLTKSLNIGLKKCSGDYIARFDDDDMMDKTRIEKQVNFLNKNSQIAACVSNFYCIDEFDNIITEQNINIKPEKYIDLLFNRNPFCHSSLMIRKEIMNSLNGYNEKLLYAQDKEFYIRLLSKYNMGCINEPLVFYRINQNVRTQEKVILQSLMTLYPCILYTLTNPQYKLKLLRLLLKNSFYYVFKLKKEINSQTRI